MAKLDTTFTHNGSIFTFSVQDAPKDTNGNMRIDIQVFKDGKEMRETIKGYRKVKNGYRTQLGAHGYDYQEAINDMFNLVKGVEPTKEEKAVTSKPRKSNSKEATELIRKYIMDNLSEDETTDLAEQLNNAVRGFRSYYNDIHMGMNKNLQKAFRAWLQCLPSELYATPHDQEQSELLCDWMNTHGRSYSAEATNKMFYALLYREFNKLCALKHVPNIYGTIKF